MEGLKHLFENNLINWIILMLLLAYMWAKVTPGIFAARKARIDASLNEAEQARIEGLEFAKKQEAIIANAEEELKKILEDSKQVAATMSAEINKQTEIEVKSLRERIDQQIANEQQQAITEMRSRAATVALRLAEASLPGAITDSAKARLLNQFVDQLESGGIKK